MLESVPDMTTALGRSVCCCSIIKPHPILVLACVLPTTAVASPRCHLLPAGDALQLVTGPHTEDGADSEVGVNNAAAVQGVKGHAEALSTHVDGLRHLLRASILAHVLRGKQSGRGLVSNRQQVCMCIGSGVALVVAGTSWS